MTPTEFFNMKYKIAYMSDKDYHNWHKNSTEQALAYHRELDIRSGGSRGFQYAEWWRCEKFEAGKWNSDSNGADGWDANNHPQEIKKISGNPNRTNAYNFTHGFKDLVLHNFQRNIDENWRVNLVVQYKSKITLCLSYDFGDPVFVDNIKQTDWYTRALRHDKDYITKGGKRASGDLRVKRRYFEDCPSFRIDYFDREVYEESSKLYLTRRGMESKTSRFIEGLVASQSYAKRLM